ncbi:MAG: hypothetical protein B7Y31_08185, partial [Novosphingobium sp. 16-62-11]
KAKIIRVVKACEIAIMVVGGAGLVMAWLGMEVEAIAIPLMLAALLAMGVHSTFFGPIKYAILPQHLHDNEVLAGTGLVEAGTYIAILAGTILAGWIPVEVAAGGVVLTALIGYISGRQVPPAPPLQEAQKIDFNVFTSSWRLIRNTTRHRQVFMAIIAISFFWTVGTVLFIQFPPLAKNVLYASKEVASLFLVMFSVGIAIGSMSINALLKGTSVDGVYDADPKKDASAKRYDTVDYDTVLAQNLKVMDASAVALCRDNNIPIVVFSIREQGNLALVLSGGGTQTIVKKDA